MRDLSDELDELITVITEIEAMINERPLTYVSSDLDEPVPLTPSMLVHGCQLTLLPHYSVSADELEDLDYNADQTTLCKRAKHLDLLVKNCWQRWKMEYLPQLREAHIANEKRHRHGHGVSENSVTVGDVVLVHCDNEKRALWPLAVVTRLHTGNDGLVRSVEIKTKRGITNRSVTKLYPLEIKSVGATDDGQSEETKTVVTDEESRPKRTAAIKARSLIKGWISELSH